MSTVNLIESFGEFKDIKNIDRVTMMGILEDVFRGVVKRRFGEEANVDIIINPDKGDLEMWLNRIIVEDGMSEDDNLDIELAEAQEDRARLRSGRRSEPRGEDRGLRSAQHPFPEAEPPEPDHGAGEGPPVQQVQGACRRDHHRRGVPDLEARDLGAGR